MTTSPSYDVAHPAPIIATTTGKVRGRWQNASSAAYLGVPFAAPPVGELRFSTPHRHEAWGGIRPAIDYGPTPQRRPFGPVVTIPEPSIPGDSTLNVNVFTPAPRDRGAGLPVLVWIHGGGYFAGSPSSPWYNGRAFNADGVVTVSVSYRLGFQGFGWVRGAPLNRGLLDQIAALTWVQENIREFGGDPQRVTIAGQSAGGGSVLALVGSPRAAGLFRGAISESGAFNSLRAEQAEKVGLALARAVGVDPDIESWSALGETAILDHERDVNNVEGVPGTIATAGQLLDALERGFIGDSNLAFAPVVDGDVLLEPFRAAYENGVGANVSLLMGSARNEFSFPLPGGSDLSEAEEEFRAAGLSEEAIARYSDEVHRIGEDRVAGQLMTTYMFRVGIAHTAAIRNAAGAGARTWLYDFGQTSSVSNASMHCEEIPYVFNVLDAPRVGSVLGEHPSQPLADSIHGTWAKFVSTAAIDQPTVADHPRGAIRFLGGERYEPEAYRFEGELVDRALRKASPDADGH